MSKTLELKKFFGNITNISNFKRSKTYRRLYKQKEKNTRFGNYKKSTNGTTFGAYRKKELKLHKKALYRLKKKICSYFKNSLINTNNVYLDETIFYDNTDLFEIKNFKNYVFFLKKLVKFLLIFLTNSNNVKLYSDLDFLRYLLNQQVKIFPILKTHLSKRYQNISSKNIKNFKNTNIIPTVVATILTDEQTSSIENEKEFMEEY